jgi:hypothetical protein
MKSALPLQAQIIYERCATTLNVALNDNKGRFSPLYHWGKENIDRLNFYTVEADYVQHLQKAEQDKRGFSRVPNMVYSEKYKQKFLCGIVLQVNDVDYYVPVTSYKQQKPDNFLIVADNGKVVSSLRFNYGVYT